MITYNICPNAQIDLTTFNRSAQYMGTLPTDHAGIDKMLRDIDVSGGMLNDVSLYGSMTDTVDQAFYPVDINGQPIKAGYYAEDGSTLTSAPTDNTSYYEWVNDGGTWTITWHNQTFAWADEDTPGWKTNFYHSYSYCVNR